MLVSLVTESLLNCVFVTMSSDDRLLIYRTRKIVIIEVLVEDMMFVTNTPDALMNLKENIYKNILCKSLQASYLFRQLEHITQTKLYLNKTE